ncbi:MAG: glycine cleavage system aminomethyltransferase GcvT [Deltaproteobacteria bacterium]|nr:glycine cleavage system aminomethyltransferase GcvT [Deltaproteobacteria bacterium]
MADARRTPLYEKHRAAGARFVEFGGWQMPVQYRGLLAEHEAVRTRAGLFDVSHMGEIEVAGPGALALCQRIATNDASSLAVGRAQYTIWCDESGGTIDDTILYRRGPERFLFCVNASNTATCVDWIGKQAGGLQGALVRDRSDATCLLALQGPKAVGWLASVGAPWIEALPRFGCAEGEVLGLSLFAARTGYTGEDGVELFVDAGDAPALWEALLEHGREDPGLEPIGLGARDTLRLEAALPLYGHELGRDISPLEAGLGWAVKLGKKDFIGAAALASQRERGVPRRLIGLRLVDKGIARATYPVTTEERRVGEVTSGTLSPTLGQAIALALIDQEWLDAPLYVEIRGRRVAAERVGIPFYRRSGPGRDGA